MTQFDKRLVPNYIAALLIIGVFLWSFTYVILNFENFSDIIIVEDSSVETAIRASAASAIITAEIFILKEVTSYLFRKNPTTS